MKFKLLLFCIFFCPALSFAQHSYFDVSMGVDLPQELEHGFSARFGGGAKVGECFLAGFNLGITKLNEMQGLYMPLSASFRAMPGPGKKVSPFVVAEPGYGVYNHTGTVNNAEVVTKGGFTFFGGAGIYISDKKSKPYITVGYSMFTFENEAAATKVATRYEGVSIRAGLTLFDR